MPYKFNPFTGNLDIEGPIITGSGTVSAAADGTAQVPGINFANDLNTGIYRPGNDQIAISTGGNGRLFIDSSGNVGIGTSSPTSILDIREPDNTAAIVKLYGARTSVGNNCFFTGFGSRGSTASPSSLQADDIIATFNANAHDGSNYLSAGRVRFGVESISTGALNSNIQFLTNDGSSEAERMRIDSSGNVGIGTSSPQAIAGYTVLTLNNSSQGGAIEFKNNNTSYGRLLQGSSAVILETKQNIPLIFGTGTSSTERMRIDSSGNVGIGTTSPTGTLQINKNATNAANAGITLKSADSNESLLSLGVSTSLGKACITSSENGTGTALPIAFTVGSSSTDERMRIDTSGRLLVGTSTSRDDGVSLQVEGVGYLPSTIQITRNSNNADGGGIYIQKTRATANGGVTVVQSGDELGYIKFRGADGTDAQSIGAQISAAVDGTPGANDMPGRLVFSTTADGASSPTERMRISADGAFRCFSANTVVRAFSATGAGTTEYLYGGYYSATDNLGTASTLSFSVFTNGDTVNTNNSYGAISDIKLKENIVDANSQWADLKALQVRNYNFKEGQTHTQIGLVAQEVELVSPGLVTESPDRDEDGNDLGTVTKSVNYSVLYMKAVKALQEAMERIETLEQRLSDAGIA